MWQCMTVCPASVPTLIPTLYPSGLKRSSNNFLPSSTMAQSAVFSSAVTEK